MRSQSDEQLIESYRRIVEGYEDEIRTARYQRDEYKRQRDELVAACERCIGFCDNAYITELNVIARVTDTLRNTIKAARGEA